jgi:hypothetical protein
MFRESVKADAAVIWVNRDRNLRQWWRAARRSFEFRRAVAASIEREVLLGDGDLDG